jgi:sialate O-acetylesterase
MHKPQIDDGIYDIGVDVSENPDRNATNQRPFFRRHSRAIYLSLVFLAVLALSLGLGLGLGLPRKSQPPFLSNVFGSSQVLQSGAPIELWGWSTTGVQVSVTLGSLSPVISAPAGPDGAWRVMLPPQPAGGLPHGFSLLLSENGGERRSLSLTGILFGDVYWCGGQSNMAGSSTPVSYALDATQEIAASAAYPFIRVFTAPNLWSKDDSPLAFFPQDPPIPWSQAGPSSISGFSATCWFTGKGIADGRAAAGRPVIPIGLIESAWDGTSIQAWSPPETFTHCGAPLLSPSSFWPIVPSSLWNTNVSPFAGIRTSGIVFYQGEANAMAPLEQSAYYSCALPLFFSGLRRIFLSPSAHVVAVQISPWVYPSVFNAQVALLREAQRETVSGIAEASIVTAVDGGDPYAPLTSIHPRKVGVSSAPSVCRLCMPALPLIPTPPYFVRTLRNNLWASDARLHF